MSVEPDGRKDDMIEPEPYRAMLLRVALRYVHRREDADDVVQDTMLEAIEGSERFAETEVIQNIEAWLVAVCRNKAATLYKRRELERKLFVHTIKMEDDGVGSVVDSLEAPPGTAPDVLFREREADRKREQMFEDARLTRRERTAMRRDPDDLGYARKADAKRAYKTRIRARKKLRAVLEASAHGGWTVGLVFAPAMLRKMIEDVWNSPASIRCEQSGCVYVRKDVEAERGAMP